MLFDDFKEEMTYKYGYDSGAGTTEDVFDKEKKVGKCDLCDL